MADVRIAVITYREATDAAVVVDLDWEPITMSVKACLLLTYQRLVPLTV